jgi:hypothetical protein
MTTNNFKIQLTRQPYLQVLAVIGSSYHRQLALNRGSSVYNIPVNRG